MVALMAAFAANAQFSTDPAVLKIAAGETKDVVFSLKTEVAISAYQLKIQCPTGIEVATMMNDDDEEVPAVAFVGNRHKSKHDITCIPSNNTPGLYTIIVASSTSQELRDLEGEVFKVTFKATADEVKDPIQITDQVVSTAAGEKTNFEAITLGVNADAINSISAEQTKTGAIFNLNGQRVSKTTKGIYVIDGKKVAVK